MICTQVYSPSLNSLLLLVGDLVADTVSSASLLRLAMVSEWLEEGVIMRWGLLLTEVDGQGALLIPVIRTGES